MGNSYKHHTGALVEIDDNGKKKIIYDGKVFRTFKEVMIYKSKVQPKPDDSKELRDRFEREKGDM